MTEPLDQSTERARARVGATVDGKWHLDSLLGMGGMAAVYAGTHRNGTRAAIKILNPEIALNTNAKTRFLREGYVANKIGHDGVVLVLDDDEAPDGTVYIVMELLEGQTLHALVSEGTKLDAVEVLRIAHDVLEVLELAHAKDIIHRDLKPGNLMLAPDGAVKLLDFGVAKVKEGTNGSVPNVTTLSTMGTPGFMPPEQARGRWDNIDGRADLWALGATMFALLTCRYVHEEETPNEQLLAAMTKPAPRLHDVMPEADPLVAEIVDRALAFDREQRYAGAVEMKAAVASAMRELADGRRSAVPSDAKPALARPASIAPAPAAAPATDGGAVSDVRRASQAGAERDSATAGTRVSRSVWGFMAAGAAAIVVVAFALQNGARDASPSAPAAVPSATPETTFVKPPPPPPSPSTVSAAASAPASSGAAAAAPSAGAAVPNAAVPNAAVPPNVATARGASPPKASTPDASAGSAHAADASAAPPAASIDIFGRRH